MVVGRSRPLWSLPTQDWNSDQQLRHLKSKEEEEQGWTEGGEERERENVRGEGGRKERGGRGREGGERER